MKKIKRRTASVLILAVLVLIGLAVYAGRYTVRGGRWASFISNGNVYSGGVLTVGTVLDRNGVVLSDVTDGVRTFAEDKTVRLATLHAVGDTSGNIGTGALSAFASELIGYDPIFGTYSLNGSGKDLYLTIDSDLNVAAYKALNGRSGTVAICNYETGEVLCMVSSPTYDPADPPEITEGDSKYEGVYINRFLSSSYTPGSVFKIVTLSAAIENIDDLYNRRFKCDGSIRIAGDTVVCTRAHGTLSIEEALAVSCNITFAQLSEELGGELLKKYADQFGLTSSLSVDGVQTAAGNFDMAEDGTANLAWSGIGQYNDTVNPCAMLRLMGAIANGGVAVEPELIVRKGLSSAFSGGSVRLMSSDTADQIAAMMNYNVTYTYGEENFPGLKLYAKSGTAEVGGGRDPHAWFVGFIKNEDYPLAFVVVVENGGWGSAVAGSVANTVLQVAVAN